MRTKKEILERIKLIEQEKGKYPIIPSNIELRMSLSDRVSELLWMLNND